MKSFILFFALIFNFLNLFCAQNQTTVQEDITQKIYEALDFMPKELTNIIAQHAAPNFYVLRFEGDDFVKKLKKLKIGAGVVGGGLWRGFNFRLD